MSDKKTLLLASQSSSRARLLKEIGINFVCIDQSANEHACDWSGSLADVLKSIAVHKMTQAALAVGKNVGELCFVLTADTMGQGCDGLIHAKPSSKEEAKKQIRSLNGTGICGTAFCLDRRFWDGSAWIVQERHIECVIAEYEFYIPVELQDEYLSVVSHYSSLSGSISIEGYGAQFLKSINGSYSAIIGLPLFELRKALECIGFF